MSNILSAFDDMLGSHFHKKGGGRKLFIAGREIDVVGASDVKAEATIRGSTYSAALVDEITVIPEPVFKQLTARLSIRGARLFGTTNPDSPYHWFKKDYIDRADEPDIDLRNWQFNFDDNPSLDEAYIRNIKAECQGLWYKRFIEGLWVLAEGAIYDFFEEKQHCILHAPNIAREYAVGIDYGTTNPCVFVLVGYNPDAFPQLWLEKEYYYDSQKSNRQKTDSEYASDMAKFIEGLPVRAIYIDPSAASFKNEMRRAGICNIVDADNDVMNGIRVVAELLNAGTFKICKNAKNAIAEMSNYIWDARAALNGKEQPLKQHDHVMDALRYVLFSRYRRLGQSYLTEKDIDRMREEALGLSPELPSFFRGGQYFNQNPSWNF
jgi:PBSX family phage terminase large subunit